MNQLNHEKNFYLSQISALREEHDPHEPLRGAHVQQRRLDRLVPRRRLPHVRLGGQSKSPHTHQSVKSFVFCWLRKETGF